MNPNFKMSMCIKCEKQMEFFPLEDLRRKKTNYRRMMALKVIFTNDQVLPNGNAWAKEFLRRTDRLLGMAQLEKIMRFDSNIVANYFNASVPSGSSPAAFVVITKMTNFTFKQMAAILKIGNECFEGNDNVLLSLPAVEKWKLDDLVDIDNDLQFSRTDPDITKFKDEIAK